MILKNGYIIRNNKLVKKDILIVDNIIKEIADNISGDDYIDISNCLAIPGGIDVHVHLREPGYSYKETIKTGTMSAAKGGITTLMCMPNLKPCPDNIASLNYLNDLIAKDALVNVYPYCSLSVKEEGSKIADLEELSKHVYAISDDGVGVNDITILAKAMKIAKQYNLVIASHAEDLIDSKLPQGEYVAVRREVELAKEIGVKYHFCHLSTAESFDAIRKAHEEGYNNITCEVSPHHLFLNEEMIKDGNWKMNPPLRSKINQEETIKALLDGTASIIASDHAPHSVEEKMQEYSKCPNGIIGLETMIPLVYTNLIETKKASYNDFINWLVNNPIKVFNLPPRKLAKGYPADIAVLDITTKRKYTEAEIKSLGKNSPFIGMELTGFAKYTIVAGKIVWRG